MRHAKEYQRGAKVKAVLFFGVMIAAMVISLILPLRPTSSPLEKREHLTAFPEFSTEALLDGTYFDGIDLWFSDTFPYRDQFFQVNKKIRNYYGIRTVEIHGEVTQGDDIPDSPFTGN